MSADPRWQPLREGGVVMAAKRKYASEAERAARGAPIVMTVRLAAATIEAIDAMRVGDEGRAAVIERLVKDAV